MKLYLCGPMTVTGPDLNIEVFAHAASVLRADGHEVFNPGEHDPGLDYAECMRIDIAEVLAADAVAVLPGWREGVGSRLEVGIALAINTPVYVFHVDRQRPLVECKGYAGRDALRALLDGGAA